MDTIFAECRDGTVITASCYTPVSRVQAAIMIAPATGIRRRFYHHFAAYLADQGYAVITFDNRGIGDSLQGPVSSSQADLVQWGQQDMSAVLEQLQQRFPDTSYHLIGHSAGGQLFGLMDNAQQLTSIFNVACSSGQLSNMKPLFQLQAHLFMNLFIPLCNRLLGHSPAHWLGMGAALPRGVARQWQRWCNGSGYVATAFDQEIGQHYYYQLNQPALWLNADDDSIANDANVADMQRVFEQLKSETLTLHPQQYGLKQIGHMGYFSRKCQALWPLATDWLDKHRPSA